MDAESLFFAGERGFHLLFEPRDIAAAFEQDAEALREIVDARRSEIERVLVQLLALPSARDGRALVLELEPSLRHVLVLLYFELLDGRMRRRRTVH